MRFVFPENESIQDNTDLLIYLLWPHCYYILWWSDQMKWKKRCKVELICLTIIMVQKPWHGTCGMTLTTLPDTVYGVEAGLRPALVLQSGQPLHLALALLTLIVILIISHHTVRAVYTISGAFLSQKYSFYRIFFNK